MSIARTPQLVLQRSLATIPCFPNTVMPKPLRTTTINTAKIYHRNTFPPLWHVLGGNTLCVICYPIRESFEVIKAYNRFTGNSHFSITSQKEPTPHLRSLTGQQTWMSPRYRDRQVSQPTRIDFRAFRSPHRCSRCLDHHLNNSMHMPCRCPLTEDHHQ